jgi:hypothetical protein
VGKRAKAGRGKQAEAPAPRRIGIREVYLLDELGRFVAGATAEGVPVLEGMAHGPSLALARAVAAGREVPPGTFVCKVEGDAAATVYGGREFFGCAGADAGKDRDAPLELQAVVSAFEHTVARELEAGGLTRASIEAFPKLAAAALKDPARYGEPPVGPLAFARASFRASGARLALDLEVVNATPWDASRVELRLSYDARALPLVSVKAQSGGFAHGVLTLPTVKARSRDRAVLLFEPRSAGVHVVGGELTLGLEGGGERRAPMRRARTVVPAARVVATVPKSLQDFQGLVEGRLKYAAPLELPAALGGRATVAALATEIEKDAFAKVLDWRGARGEREVWYLGLAGGPERPVLVQLTQSAEADAETVVAAARRGDVLGFCARLRARMGPLYAGAPAAQRDVPADGEPEARPAALRASIVARQISADLGSQETETGVRRPRPSAATARSAGQGGAGGRSAGEELVPGLIDALERSLAVERIIRDL